MRLRSLFLALAVAVGALGSAGAQPVRSTLLRATELRTEKLAFAPAIATLPVGTPMRVLSVEGGWVWAETEDPPLRRGWVRASAVNLATRVADVSTMRTGRLAEGNRALTLGVRSLTPRAGRHALIIGVSKYADASIPPLPGTHIDRESATQMAHAMQVPDANIQYLQDDQATGDAIRKALRELTAKVEEGDRVFVHFSGHGTRYNDKEAGGCVEALLAYDAGQAGRLTNREMSQLLEPLTRKTDKLFVMYDACHSGGVLRDATLRTRGLVVPTDEGRLRPKFSPTDDICSRPVNVKSRNLLVESTAKGALPQDMVLVSSSRDNEISFDDEQKGGLATQFMRDCMLRDARDTDGSGAISIDEIRACAQEKIVQRLQGETEFKPHNIVVAGNTGFVPAWFGSEQLAVSAPAMAPVPAAAAPQASPPSPPPAPLTGEAALQQLYEQRDAKRKVTVRPAREDLRVGKDTLEFSVESDRPGHVYVAMAASDNQSLQLLFPNDLDGDNRIAPGQPLVLPRAKWALRAGGPPGTNHLLVLVADQPRDLSRLKGSRNGPFAASLNDAAGRANLGALLTVGAGACEATTTSRCSDAFGAAMFRVKEIR